MNPLYSPYLTHIHDAISAIRRSRPTTFEALVADQDKYDAILLRVQIIGEMLVKMRAIDEDFYVKNEQPSWYRAVELRNVISHAYLGIKPERIWQTITEDLDSFEDSLHLFHSDRDDAQDHQRAA